MPRCNTGGNEKQQEAAAHLCEFIYRVVWDVILEAILLVAELV